MFLFDQSWLLFLDPNVWSVYLFCQAITIGESFSVLCASLHQNPSLAMKHENTALYCSQNFWSQTLTLNKIFLCHQCLWIPWKCISHFVCTYSYISMYTMQQFCSIGYKYSCHINDFFVITCFLFTVKTKCSNCDGNAV